MSTQTEQTVPSQPIEFDKTMDSLRKEINQVSVTAPNITAPKNSKVGANGKINPSIFSKKTMIVFGISIVVVLIGLLSCRKYFKSKPKYDPKDYNPNDPNANPHDFESVLNMKKFIVIFIILSIGACIGSYMIMKKIANKK